MLKSLLVGSLFFAGVGIAGGSELKDAPLLTTPEEADEHLTLLPTTDVEPGCTASKGVVCATTGSPGTAAHGKTTVGGTFSRIVPSWATAADKDHAPWTIDVYSELKTPTRAGTVLFMIFDNADPKAFFVRHEVAGIYQAQAPSLSTIGARLSFTPNDGFRKNHTYRVRIEQILGKREVVLAEGLFTLK